MKNVKEIMAMGIIGTMGTVAAIIILKARKESKFQKWLSERLDKNIKDLDEEINKKFNEVIQDSEGKTKEYKELSYKEFEELLNAKLTEADYDKVIKKYREEYEAENKK